MSMMHSIVFSMCKRGKRLYSPGVSQDYAASRADEVRQNRFVPIPKSVCIRETTMNGVQTELLSNSRNPKDRVILYLHGGGFVVGSTKTRRMFTIYIVGKMGYNVVAPEYRLAPEHPFPAAPTDCLAVYQALLSEYTPNRIALIGESAGGNLVLSTLLQIKALGLAMPAIALCLSPCVQFDRILPSYTQNQDTEAMVDHLSEEVCNAYLCSGKAEDIRNPLAAPFYGDFAGCPPICLWASESEVLRDDSVILYEKLTEAGHPCNLYLRDRMIHTWLIIPYIPEARKDLKLVQVCIDQAMDGSFYAETKPIRLA